MMRLILILFLPIFVSLPCLAHETQSIQEYREEIYRLDKEVSEKWSSLEQWQSNPEWVNLQSELSLAGTVYAKGWLGPKVSRKIVPDFEKGWLVVDTVSIGPDLMETLTTLSSNILLQYFLPYVQGGRVNQKSFVNARYAATYEEALLTEHFELSDIPLGFDQFEDMQKGEVFSTISTGGFYTRFGGGISNLIGLELPAHLNFGPKSKLKVEESLKVTVAKEDERHVLISIERAKDLMKGVGVGFGLFFDDVIDVPVTVGIGSSNGYSPITFNIKENRTKTQAAIYKLDISTPKGREAYQAFLNKDLTLLDDYARENERDVQLEMVKDGEIVKNEWNFAVNLILWRGGWRNIFVEAKYNTRNARGERFEYMEISGQDVHDSKSGKHFERSSSKYSTLVPLSGKGHNELQIQAKGAFILDSILLYSDTNTLGKEIKEISEDLVDLAPQLKLPLVVDEDKSYGSVNIDVRVRFTPMAIRSILNADVSETWLAVASASGLPDPYLWMTESDRRSFRRKYFNKNHFDNSHRRLSPEEKLYRRAKKVVGWLQDIRSKEDNHQKAKELIENLRDGRAGSLLHKTLLELAGLDQVIIQGSLTGKQLY